MSTPGGVMGRRARWALALRIARREVRRHPWRHALVVIVTFLPVASALAAFTGIATWNATEERRVGFERAGAPSAVSVEAEGTVEGYGYPTAEQVRRVLPDGTRTVTARSGSDWLYDPVGATDGLVPLGAATWSLPVDGALDPSYLVRHGRLPRDADEIFLSRRAALDGHWAVGDRIATARTGQVFTVSGIGERGDDLGGRLAVVSDQVGRDFWSTRTDELHQVDRGDGTASLESEGHLYVWLEPDQLDARLEGASLTTRADGTSLADDLLGPGAALAGATLCALVAVVTSAAFAVGARRQLRQVGLLATAGADPAVIRNALLLQGALPGAIAGALATAVVVGTATAVNRSGRFVDAVDVAGAQVTVPPVGAAVAVVFAIGAGVLAAWHPARTAAKMPLLSALSGRRPVPALTHRTPLAGIGLAAVGTGFLAGYSTTVGRGKTDPVLVVALAFGGVVAFVAGAIATAPALVWLATRLGARTQGTTRLALRGLARNRVQSSACVAALAVALAIPLAVQIVATDQHRTWDRYAAAQEDRSDVLAGDDLVAHLEGRLTGPGFEQTLDDVERTIGSDTIAVSIHDVPRAEQRYERIATIDAADAVRLLSPAAARAVARGEAVWLGDEAGPTFDRLLSIGGEQELPIRWATGLDGARAIDLDATALLSTEAAATVVTGRLLAGYDVHRAAPATATEAEALGSLGSVSRIRPTLGEIRAAVVRGGMDQVLLEERADPGTWVQVARSPAEVLPTDAYDRWSRIAWVAGAALALLVLAIVLALRGVDGADDRRAALAIGAPPRRLRHQQAIEGVVLALLGAALALPLGWLPITVLSVTNERRTGRGLAASLLHPGWSAVPLLLLPAASAGVLWVVVPGIRALVDRHPRDQLLPQA